MMHHGDALALAKPVVGSSVAGYAKIHSREVLDASGDHAAWVISWEAPDRSTMVEVTVTEAGEVQQ